MTVGESTALSDGEIKRQFPKADSLVANHHNIESNHLFYLAVTYINHASLFYHSLMTRVDDDEYSQNLFQNLQPGMRGYRYVQRCRETLGETGDFMAQAQQDLWGQMRFRYQKIEDIKQLDWWRVFIRTYASEPSAELKQCATGPCDLYMCYFEFNGIPCIVVPIYRHKRLALAQGIVKFTRALDVHGFYDIYHTNGLKLNRNLIRPDEPSAKDAIEQMGVSLLAQVCQCMDIDLLFAAPINFFFKQVLLFIENNRILHWLGDCNVLHNTGVEYKGIERIYERNPPVGSWIPKDDGWERGNIGAMHLKLHYISDDGSGRQGSVVNLGLFKANPRWTIPHWDILNQKWIIDNEKITNAPYYQDQLNYLVENYYPYNFLHIMIGDAVIIMDAKSMANYAPVQRDLPPRPVPNDSFAFTE